MEIKQQTSAQKTWRDEQGHEVPYTRITPLERQKEKSAFNVAKEALKIQATLVKFKQLISECSAAIFEQVLTMSEQQKARKGNFTWYNFDMSIKIEVTVDDRIEFDALLIEKAKQKLLELVGEAVSRDKAFLKGLIMGAFETSRGKLDTKKILSLKKHASRVPDERFHEAMGYIDEAITRPFSKKYFRVFLRDAANAYQHVDLNFSSI